MSSLPIQQPRREEKPWRFSVVCANTCSKTCSHPNYSHRWTATLWSSLTLHLSCGLLAAISQLVQNRLVATAVLQWLQHGESGLLKLIQSRQPIINLFFQNSYLIDPFLIIFIVTMASRQFVYALLCKYLEIIASPRLAPIAQRVTRILLLIVIICILVWCLYHMSERHNSIKVFYLCYPWVFQLWKPWHLTRTTLIVHSSVISISVYFLMFGVHIGPFFDTSTAPLYIKEDRKTKFFLGEIASFDYFH